MVLLSGCNSSLENSCLLTDADSPRKVIFHYSPQGSVPTSAPELLKLKIYGDFPGGPGAKTLCCQCRGPGVQSLVRELDPACHN